MNNLPVGIALRSAMSKSPSGAIVSNEVVISYFIAITIFCSLLALVFHLLNKKYYNDYIDFADMSFKVISFALIIFLTGYYFVKLFLFLFGN